MHGPNPQHNPLHAAARQMQDAAREAKSPLLEKVAVWAMIGSAVTAAATALLHTLHMMRRDWKEDRREKERERRAAAAPPPERPEHDAPAAMDDGARRWSSREERAGRQPCPDTLADDAPEATARSQADRPRRGGCDR